jgi:hypothetical protein
MRPGSHPRAHDSACDPRLAPWAASPRKPCGASRSATQYGPTLDPEWTAGDDAEGRSTPSLCASTAVNGHEPRRPALTSRLHGLGKTRRPVSVDRRPPNLRVLLLKLGASSRQHEVYHHCSGAESGQPVNQHALLGCSSTRGAAPFSPVAMHTGVRASWSSSQPRPRCRVLSAAC